MDQGLVQRHADAHAQAVVDGNMDRALEDLTDAAKAGIGAVAGELPNPVKSAAVTSLTAESADRYIALIRYAGDEKATTVRSIWEPVSGIPLITEATVAKVEATSATR